MIKPIANRKQARAGAKEQVPIVALPWYEVAPIQDVSRT